jgi:hypothetical protein
MNSTHLKLAIAALRMIAIGLSILALLVAVGIIKLSVFTVKAIALGIKLLNDWCDAQSSDVPRGFVLSGFKPMACLNADVPKPLITPAVLPSSGSVIAIVPRDYQPVARLAESLFNTPNVAPKKRGRPSKKVAVGFA